MPRINPFEHGLTPEDLGMKRPQEKAAEAALRHAEATKPERAAFGEDIERAREVLGQDVLGPEQVKKAFGIELDPDEVPDIPFSKEELERAKELGQMLVLRLDRTTDGETLTMEKLNSLPQPQGQLKLLWDPGWYQDEHFYTQEAPKAGWALVTKDLIPGSTRKNYVEQTELLVAYLKDSVFRGQKMPNEYQEAIEEFEKQSKDLKELTDKDWQKAAERFEQLKLTQLTRQTPVEAIYDLALVRGANDEQLLENIYTWTSRRYSDVGLVNVGSFDPRGVYVDGDRPDDRGDDLGVSFSRNL